MSKPEKREQRIRNNPDNVSLDEFEALIKRYGEIIEGGSHPKAHIYDYGYQYKRESGENSLRRSNRRCVMGAP
jgi:hypothetical protein